MLLDGEREFAGRNIPNANRVVRPARGEFFSIRTKGHTQRSISGSAQRGVPFAVRGIEQFDFADLSRGSRGAREPLAIWTETQIEHSFRDMANALREFPRLRTPERNFVI